MCYVNEQVTVTAVNSYRMGTITNAYCFQRFLKIYWNRVKPYKNLSNQILDLLYIVWEQVGNLHCMLLVALTWASDYWKSGV